MKIAIFKKFNNKGMGLVEVIAALGISVIAITALVSLALHTMRLSLQSKLELMATQTATREREMLRAYRDRSDTWADFVTGVNPCTSAACHMDVDGDGNIIPETGSITEAVEGTISYSRNFGIVFEDAPQNNVAHVTITVNWELAGKQRSTHLYTYLTNWKNE